MLSLHDVKGNIQNFFHKFQKRSAAEQADGVVDVPLSDGSSDAQKLVWDNEEASMQDKSYSFDEESTDADYDYEDDFEFENDTDTSGSGQEARYR